MRQLAIWSGKLMLFSYCSQNVFQNFNSDSSDDGAEKVAPDRKVNFFQKSMHCQFHPLPVLVVKVELHAGSDVASVAPYRKG